MFNRINFVVVDTSAYVAEQCDFMGLNSSIIPAFFELLRKDEIVIVSHPILNEEIKKHIGCSFVIEKLENLKTSLIKYKNVLKLIDVSAENEIEKINLLGLNRQMVDAFNGFYEKAITLPFPNPETIFKQYFSCTPPFSESGEKKHEFPDAFVIEAIRQHISDHHESSMLVISDDMDWKKALSDERRVSLASSIANGMKILQSVDNLIPILETVDEQLKLKIFECAESECYEISDYELMEEDLEIESIEVDEITNDIIPLKITESSALIRVYAKLIIAGSCTVLDESHSYWDKEDNKYLYVEYNNMSFKSGSAEVECEVSIGFDPEDPMSSAIVDSVKLNVKYNIKIDVDEDDIVYSSIDQDARYDAMDAMEEYYHH